MKRTAVVLGIVGIVLTALFIAGAHAQGPTPSLPSPALQGSGITGSGDTINFQGQLYDKNTGKPVTPGDYNMHFTICTDGTDRISCAASVVWSDTFAVAVDNEGFFDALFTGLDANDFAGDRWLMVEVSDGGNWDWMDPNQRLTSVAFSIGNIRKNVVDESRASSPLAVLSVINEANGRGVSGESSTGIGVYGTSNTSTGIEGYSPSSRGVYGHSDSDTGVYGRSDSGTEYGVVAHNYLGGVGLGVWSWGGDIIKAVLPQSP